MFELRVEEGRLSEHYNHFAEFELMSCEATDTRLMGVVALKLTWKGRTNKKARYYQVIHLDYSEYGFDDYYEFDCTPGIDGCSDNQEDMEYYWQHFTSVMGGKVLTIKPSVMLRLVELAMPLAGETIDREYDDEANREFRNNTILRLEMMIETLRQDGITSDSCTTEAAIAAVSPRKLATCETLNYFIMRLIDLDFDAACYLSTMTRDELRSCVLTKPGIQTLIRSSLKMGDQSKFPPRDGLSFPYRATISTLGRSCYYHATLVLFLNGDYKSVNPKVTEVSVGSMVKLSDFESAIQISQKEYLTVFEIPDKFLNNFDGSLIPLLVGVEPVATENGWLYTIYNKDNKHVNRTEYRLDDDVFGYAFLTIPGQLVLMSRNVEKIAKLDNSVLYSFYSPYLKLRGRYLLERTPVFHTLCHTQGLLFEDLVEMPSKE